MLSAGKFTRNTFKICNYKLNIKAYTNFFVVQLLQAN